MRYGNEDTFREMLRIKRSVQAQHNTQVNLMSAQMLATASKEVQVTGQGEGGGGGGETDGLAICEESV